MRAISRIKRLEKIRADRYQLGGRLKLRFAHLKILPRDYVGERHVVRIQGEPSESPDTDCQLEERPGPGPKFDFGFKEQTYLLYLVSSPVPLEDNRMIMPEESPC